MREASTSSRRILLGVALGMLVALAVLALWHPGREQRLLRHVLTWTCVPALMALFLWGGRAAVRRADRMLVVGALVLGVAALAVPAFQSSDAYAYAQTGWLQVHYDANPYTTLAADVDPRGTDSMFTSTWRDVPCVYGFVFAHVARLPARWSGGDVDRARLGFRLLSLLALFAVLAVLRGATDDPHERACRTYALAWSPFVLLHFVSNAHNDLLCGLLVLVALVGAQRGAARSVLPALVLATLTKLVAIVAIPFACVFLWRRYGARTLGTGALLAAGLGALVSLPYVLDLGAFRGAAILSEWTRPAHSLTAAVSHALAAWDEGIARGAEQGLRVLLLVALAAFVCVRLVRAVRRPTYDACALLEDAVASLFLLVVLASAKFYPWYLGMVLPAALLLPPDHRLRRMTLLLTVTWLLVFTGLGKARILDFLVMTGLPLAISLWRGRHGAGHAPEAPRSVGTAHDA